MTDYYKDKQQMTDEQIAELAPDGCDFYCYKDSEVFFHNALGLGVFNSKGESLSDDFLDSGEWKKSKPIPRKPFDISEYEFSDKDAIYIGCSNSTISIDVFDCGIPHSITFNKNDAIALAKHFDLTVEDLN